MLGVIYKVTNKTNGKIYVGKSKYDNPNYLGSGSLILRAILKYGKASFTRDVLEYADISELDSREVFWIEKLLARDPDIGYNIADGGSGGWVVPDDKFESWKEQALTRITPGRVPTEEERYKCSDRMVVSNPMHLPGAAAYYNLINKGKPYLLTDPDGNSQIVFGLKTWCRENGFNSSCFQAILRGKFSKHKGWSIQRLESKQC